MKTTYLLALLCTTSFGAMSLTGCGGGDEGDTDNACNYIPGNSYLATELRECGAGRPECYWRVAFNQDGTFVWEYSDTTTDGSYTCSGLNIMVNGSKVGRYDPETAILDWNGGDYQ